MTNAAHLTVISGGILFGANNLNPNIPADWVRAEAEKVSGMLAEAERLVTDAAAAEARAREFRLHYETIRDTHKASLARLVARTPA